MTDKTWTVVQFIDDKTVEAVPSEWVQGDTCYWPSSLIKPKLMNAIRKSEPLNTCWQSHHVKVFRNATFDDYGKARAKAKLAEDTSDLATENEEGPVKRKRTKKFLSSASDSSTSDDEESSLPPPPKFNKILIQKDNCNAKSSPSRNKDLVSPQLNRESTSEQLILGTPTLSAKSSQSSCGQCQENGRNIKVLKEQNHMLRSLISETLAEVRKIRTDIAEGKFQAIEKPTGNFYNLFPDISFPINTQEEFHNFDEMLSQNDIFESGVHEFSRLGGSVYNFTKRALSTLITNDVALKYSFLGRKGKMPFNTTRMTKLIILSAEKGKITTSQTEVETAISTWLRRASDRRTATQKKFTEQERRDEREEDIH